MNDPVASGAVTSLNDVRRTAQAGYPTRILT